MRRPGRASKSAAGEFLIEGTLAASNRLELGRLSLRLGADELALLVMFATRLVSGRAVYGRLHVRGDRRNFAQEALEEAVDLGIYAAAGLLRTADRAAEARGAEAWTLDTLERERKGSPQSDEDIRTADALYRAAMSRRGQPLGEPRGDSNARRNVSRETLRRTPAATSPAAGRRRRRKE